MNCVVRGQRGGREEEAWRGKRVVIDEPSGVQKCEVICLRSGG